MNNCELCGAPMPEGETMFRFHGYSGPCPLPPLPRQTLPLSDKLRARWLSTSSAVIDGDNCIYHGQLSGEASTLMAEAASALDELYVALNGMMPEGWGVDDTMDHMPGVKAARLALAKFKPVMPDTLVIQNSEPLK